VTRCVLIAPFIVFLIIDDFQSFFDRHAILFVDAPPRAPGEQDLVFHALYLQYLQIFESNLSEYLANLGCNDEEFLRQLQAVQDDEDCKVCEFSIAYVMFVKDLMRYRVGQ